MDGVLVELCFIGGPMIAAFAAALGDVVWALYVSVLFVAFGTWGFVHAGGVRAWGEVEANTAAPSWFGPLRCAAVRHVIACMTLAGIGIGLLEMGLTAATEAMGKPQAVGWAFAAISITSALAGLWHGALGGKLKNVPNANQFAAASLWLCVGCAALALTMQLSFGITSLLIAAFFIGPGFAPALTAIHSQMAEVAPSAQATEAFTWMQTMLLAGIGVGWGASGTFAQQFGAGSAFWAGAIALLGAAACAWQMQRSGVLKGVVSGRAV
jgi:MFS family permease